MGDTTPPVISNLHLIKGENPVVPLSGNTDDPGSMTVLENAGEWQATEANPQNGTAFLWNITLKPGLNTASLSSLDQVGNGSAAQTSVTYIPTGTATWRFSVASAGTYDVAARWIGQGSPATAVYRITHADGTAAVTASPAATGNLTLGSYRFLPGVSYAVSMDSAEGAGVAVADAVSLTPQEAGFNIFSDQLGTPRVITDANGQEVWRWEMDDPFGPNPAVGSIEMPLRFPGQVRDRETGLHYNYFRDYDPGIGRYIESDPIGLEGGNINTYGYANQNPLSFSDPLGLTPSGQILSGPPILPSTGYIGQSSCGSNGDQFPNSLNGKSIERACKNHDKCYDTCGASKAQCDRKFSDEMKATCGADVSCLNGAYIYYEAVKRKGRDPYTEAQKKACEKCK